MKKIILIMLSLLAVSHAVRAQKIDFNMSNRPANEAVAPGYVIWAAGRVQTDTRKFLIPGTERDSVTITMSSVPGVAGSNGFYTHYNKQNAVTLGYALLGDAADAIMLTNPGGSNDYYNPNTEQCGLQLKVKGLAAGQHTLMAYHSFVDKYVAVPKLNVYVNGQLAQEGVQQSVQALIESECSNSYIHFNVAGPDEEVTIQYISQLEEGKSYGNSGVSINAIVFDETNPFYTALDPTPENHDFHVNADNGTYLLQWKAAAKAIKHHILIGTKSGQLTEVGVTTDTCYTVRDLYTMNTYFWRIDEETAEGDVYQGTEWSFRARQLAFPDAEGYGRFAQGGRGGDVYHVTSLADDGTPGTFRYGLTSANGPRTIVFDVSGIITLESRILSIGNNLTIAGQTAPGHGVCFRKNPIGLSSDDIVRFVRLRKGAGDTGDGMGMAGSANTILDHASISWTIDEAFSSRNARDITLQRTMLAEALGIAGHKNYPEGTNHGYAASIGGDVGSFHHNLLVDCNGRNWSLAGALDNNGYYGGKLDIFNNVVYNWYSRATDGGAHQVNFVGNYYRMGIDTRQKYILNAQFEGVGKGTQSYYVHDNIREDYNGTIHPDVYNDTYTYGLYNGQVLDWEPWVSEPFFPSYAKVESAKDAFKSVCSDVGATQPFFDAHDQRMVDETVNKKWTYKGSKSGIRGEIDTEEDCGGYEVYPEETRAADFDTDQDGMPNWYEQIIGSDPNTANNNDDPDHDGWTLLEDYLELMAHKHIELAPGATEIIELAPLFAGYTLSPVYTAETVADLQSSINDGKLTITAGSTPCIRQIAVTVTDSEGSSYTRKIYVAVTGQSTGIQDVDNFEQLKVKSFSVHTLDGKLLLSGSVNDAGVDELNLRGLGSGVFVLTVKDSHSKTHVYKILRK